MKLLLTRLKKKTKKKAKETKESAAARLGGEPTRGHIHSGHWRRDPDGCRLAEWEWPEAQLQNRDSTEEAVAVVGKEMDSFGEWDSGIRHKHFQRTQQDGGYMGKPRGGREDGQLGDRKEVGSEEHQNDQRILGCRLVIKAVHTGVRLTICKVALQLSKCSAMQAEIKECELLHRTLNEKSRMGHWVMVTWTRP